MKNNEKVYNFLMLNGFKLIKKDTSDFFGDYYDLFTNGFFQLRLSSSKSFETIDIKSILPDENWYDLALVKAILYNEKKLDNITTIENHLAFLQKEITNISDLFNNKNYLVTKKRLEDLGVERVKQMFTGYI